MQKLSHVFSKASLLGILASIAVPFGLYAYTGGFASTPLPIDQPVGYVAQDDVTSFDLTSNAEVIFRPEYNRQYWSGDLHAFPVSSTGLINASVENWTSGSTPAAKLLAQNWDTGRFIGTMNDAGAGIAFRETSMSSTSFPAPPAISGNTYTRTNLLAYLRGDSTNEGGGGLRQRASPLGDIIHSRPYYLNDDTYDTVFVGANDGMLHAFDATSGAERWAYVPSMLQPKLKTLAFNPLDASNTFKHDYFVDGQINIGTINGGAQVALFGSLGAGGQGIYALDISTLTASSDADVAAKALWEITPSSIKYNNAKTSTTSYGNLGYTYGTPQIVKLNIGGSATDALIIGNGYNTSGISSLFVINAATGARIAEIVTSTTSTGANGIFEAKALDVNNDGYVDRVYAGDLNGKLWRFDLSAASSSSWSVMALFTTANNLPITSTPGVVKHPSGGYMVDFGTGSTLSGAYGSYNHSTNAWTTQGTGDMATASPATYYVYGIWDKGGSTAVVDTDLVLQTMEERAYAATAASTVTTRVRRASANAIDWTSKKGWKVALPAGERVVGEGSFLENGRFYFNSYNPTVAPKLIDGTTTDIYGENWLMELNAITGGSSSAPFLDLNGDQLLNDSDRIKYVSGDTKPSGASDGDPITVPNEKGIPVGKFIANGVQSQPLLVELQKLNTTFMNQNPDVIYPTVSTVERGVAGGHFDVDYFYPPAGNCNNLAGSAGSKAVGSVKFTYASGSKKATVNALKITAPNGEVIYNGSPGSIAPNTLDDTLNGVSSASYTLSKNGGGDASTVLITAISPGTAYNGNITVLMSVGGSVSTRYTITALAGGSNSVSPSSTSNTQCSYTKHLHEYDDLYDKTGMNFLNPSSSAYLLSAAIPSTSTPFKVLVMNQYLNPAVQIHIGRTDYNPASAVGYTAIKDYQTASGLTISALPSYTRATIGSFALNMPVDAFSVKNWWGATAADYRVGLLPTSPQCVYYGKVDASGNNTASATADLYNPVIPDSGASGTPGTSSGVRHNGAITVQIIRGTTPDTALELNYAGHPEYGYRIKSANFYDYVLAEYAMYWHHPSRVCFGDSTTRWYNGSQYGNGYSTASSGAWNTAANMLGTGWTKAANPDTKASTANATPAPNSTDPSIGALGSSGGTAANVTTTVNNNVTTTKITYTDSSYTIIVSTTTGGKTTITTTDYTASGTVVSTRTVVVADASGSTTSGGDERGTNMRASRISWRELLGQ